MLEDVRWRIAPRYEMIGVAWASTVVTSYFAQTIISYLNSKPPLAQSAMDIVNKFLFLIVVILAVWIGMIATMRATFDDSGQSLALVFGWVLFTLLTCSLMEVLANVLIQLYIILKPDAMESVNFEQAYTYSQLCLKTMETIGPV